MMNKQVLLAAFALTLGISTASYLYLEKKTDKSYSQRQDGPTAEPFTPTEFQLDANTGTFDPMNRINAYNSLAHRASRATPIGMDWEFRGPDNVGGRTRAMLELKGQPDKLLAASITGGLYVSYDAGAHWQPHAQFQNLDSNSSIISCIVEDTISDIIYVGTGSSFDRGGTVNFELPGFGLFKSTDGGETFTHITSTTPEDRLDYGTLWTATNRLAVGPDGSIYAATQSGLWASHDGGENWENPIYVDPSMTINNSGICSDVGTTPSGRIVVCFASGSVYISETGEDMSFILSEDAGLPVGGVTRLNLAIYPGDEDIMYIAHTASNESLYGIYKTTNGGESWSRILVPHDDFSPYCSSAQCQGGYDATIGVSPIDPNTIFMGGVEIWRYDGSLTRVANEFGSPPASDVLPAYVHADKHFIYFSPNDPRRMYVTTDGGISMTMNRGETWQGMNKGYTSTQFYGMAFSPFGGIVGGGTQDNGTLFMVNDNPNDPNYAVEANGGDGFDTEVSQASGMYFATSQYGVLVRGENGLPSARLSNDDGSKFWTVLGFWESTNDLTSKDSIIFNNDSTEQSIAVSNGAVKSYQETIVPVQAAARVIPNSIRVYSGNQEFTNRDDATVLVGDGNGSITFEENGSFTVDVNFLEAPSENSNIFVRYAVRYKANDILNINSENLNANLSSFSFEHRLENDLNPGDQITIQDPVQSILAKSRPGGLGLYRGVLDTRELPEVIDITGVSGSVHAVEFTSDGNVAYVGSGSSVFRISGLNEFYTEEDEDDLAVSNIYSASGGQVLGISVDPTDDSRIVLAVTGYNHTRNVVELTNAYSGSPTPRIIHGDLPTIPVYDVEIDKNDPNTILIGTEFGVWSTTDASASDVSWADENNSEIYIPVWDVRQQKLGFPDASNDGVYYLGTYGRGIWESKSLVGIGDPVDFGSESSVSGFKVFPNPVSDYGSMEFESNFNGNVTMTIYDLNGRAVKSWQHRAVSGTNRTTFDVTMLRSGTYFATIEGEGFSDASKFIVFK